MASMIVKALLKLLDVLELLLHHLAIAFCRLDGSTNRVQRAVDISEFNKAGSE